MRARLKQAAKVLLGHEPSGRNVTIHGDDVLIVSYPKSGNTWARFLVGNLADPDAAIGFRDLERRLPNIYQSDGKLRRERRPRILKSHEYFDPRYRKVLYFVRDPRDVAVSYYHFHVKIRLIDDGYPMDRYVSRFVAGDLDAFGSWQENVGSWLGAREGDEETFLLLRYEDVLAHPVDQLRRAARFLGLPADDDALTRAVALSSADHMRQLEREQPWDLDLIRDSRADRAFVRSARAGGWRDELSRESIAEIEQAWGGLMRTLGYALSVPASR